MSETHAETIRFVRSSMLPPADPPRGQSGVILWLRENLFSGWLNIALTILSVAAIWWIVAHLAPWLLNSVWYAGSLSECREVLAAHAAGPETSGACWAVVRDRWVQLLMGSFPPDQYWRPILALVLLIVALLPVLFPERTPRVLRLLTAVYPFLMPWLIWGGSFWVPLLVIAGFGVGYLAFRIGAATMSSLGGTIAAIVAALLWWAVAMPWVNDSLHRTIALSRMDAALEQARTTVETLPPIVAALEAERDAINAQAAELVARKNQLIAEIRAERFRRQIGQALPEITELLTLGSDPGFQEVQRRYSALREILTPFNTAFADPDLAEPVATLRDTVRAGVPRGEDQAAVLTDEAREALEVMANAAAEARELAAREGLRDADLAAKVAEFDGLMIQITRLREAATAVGSDIFRTDERRRAATNMVRNIEQLQRNETEIPERRAEAAEMRAALPESVAAIVTLPENRAALAEEVTAEEFAALTEVIRLEERLVQSEIAVESTYKNVGRIGLQPIGSEQFGGFQLSLLIGVTGILLSLPLGILLALGRRSDLPIIRYSSVMFIEVIRGVPLIVWLMVANFLLNFFLPPGTEFDKVLRVIIMVTLFSAAYIAEVVRGGLAALPKGQFEAADSLGLDYWKSMRLIVLPQALKISIPGIVNTFIGLFKDTTLVVFIGLFDPVNLSNTIRATTEWNGIYWELFIFVGFLFFTFCYGMSRYSLFLEKKLAREHR